MGMFVQQNERTSLFIAEIELCYKGFCLKAISHDIIGFAQPRSRPAFSNSILSIL
jgi:hypothetical protein